MSQANPLWGAPRIHGELLKLGIAVSQATVEKYLLRNVTQREPQHDTAATPCAAGTGCSDLAQAHLYRVWESHGCGARHVPAATPADLAAGHYQKRAPQRAGRIGAPIPRHAVIR